MDLDFLRLMVIPGILLGVMFLLLVSLAKRFHCDIVIDTLKYLLKFDNQKYYEEIEIEEEKDLIL